ncbi:MAG: DNA polymerase III subunit delta [Magnetococcus sp. DMHC-1]|nr:DNA polymerase III subunit delta [Magnetococcales bacterium]
MKLRSTDLAGRLRTGSWPPAILLYGSEQGQIRDAVERIQTQIFGKHAEDADFDAELFHGGTLDPERFMAAWRALPFVAARRLIAIREAEQVATAQLSVIKTSLERPNPTTLLVFTAGAMDAKNGLRKLFEADKQAWCIPFYPLEGRAFQKWLQEYLTTAGYSVDTAALEHLTQRLEGDTGIARQELEKLMLYQGTQRHLDLAAVLAVVGETVDYSLFALAEMVTAGDTARALHILDRLLERGEEPLLLLGTLTARLRRLIQLQGLLANGHLPAQALDQLYPKPFWKDKDSLLSQAQVITAARLAETLLVCQAADAGLKGVQKLPARQIMERMVIRLGHLCAKSPG